MQQEPSQQVYHQGSFSQNVTQQDPNQPKVIPQVPLQQPSFQHQGFSQQGVIPQGFVQKGYPQQINNQGYVSQTLPQSFQ